MSDKMNFAGIAQAIKYQIRSGEHWDDLTPAAKESLDQIATSIARTVCGDGAHWDGIIGFAQAARPVTATPVFPVEQNSLGQGLNKPVPTAGLEREIHKLVREIPHRNGDA